MRKITQTYVVICKGKLRFNIQTLLEILAENAPIIRTLLLDLGQYFVSKFPSFAVF